MNLDHELICMINIYINIYNHGVFIVALKRGEDTLSMSEI